MIVAELAEWAGWTCWAGLRDGYVQMRIMSIVPVAALFADRYREVGVMRASEVWGLGSRLLTRRLNQGGHVDYIVQSLWSMAATANASLSDRSNFGRLHEPPPNLAGGVLRCCTLS